MGFSKLPFLISAILILAVYPKVFCGDLKFNEPKVGSNGTVVFSYILESLPLSAKEVFSASLNYLQKEYKTTIYKNVESVPEKGIVYGKGEFSSFYTDNGLVKTEIFSAEYYLRMDAKDGRARIQLVFTNYDVKELSDASKQTNLQVSISKVAPFAEAENNGRYKKAFKALTANANIVLNSVVENFRSVNPSPILDEW